MIGKLIGSDHPDL